MAYNDEQYLRDLEAIMGGMQTAIPSANSDPGFWQAFQNSLYSTAQGTGQLAADVIPGVGANNALESWGRAGVERNPITIMQGESDSSLSNLATNLVENPLNTASQILGGAAGYMMPGGVLKVASKIPAVARAIPALEGMIASTPAQSALYGLPSYGMIRDTQEQSPDQSAWDIPMAMLGAGTIGAIESRFGPERLLNLGDLGVEAGKNFMRTGLKTGLVEGGEEIMQAPVERWASNQEVFSPETADQMGAGFLAGFVGGAPIGMVSHPFLPKGQQPQDLLEKPGAERTTLQGQGKLGFENTYVGFTGEQLPSGLTRDQYLAEDARITQLMRYAETAAANAQNPAQQNAATKLYYMAAEQMAQLKQQMPAGVGLGSMQQVMGADPQMDLFSDERTAPTRATQLPEAKAIDYQQRINAATGLAGQTANTAKDAAAAFNEPSGVRVADPDTQQEVELSMGDLNDLRQGYGLNWEAIRNRVASKPESAPKVPAVTQGTQVAQAKVSQKQQLLDTINSLVEVGSDEHANLINIVESNKTPLQARRQMAKASMEGLRVALRTAPTKERDVIMAALGWDEEGNQVTTGLDSYQKVADKLGFKDKQSVARILGYYGINAEALTRLNAAPVTEISAAELLPTQGVDEGVGSMKEAGFSVVDNPSQYQVQEGASADMSDEERSIARANVADTKAANDWAAQQGVKKSELTKPLTTTVETKAEQDAAAKRAEETTKAAKAAIAAAFRSPNAQVARSDWNDARAENAPTFDQLTPAMQAAWITEYDLLLDNLEDPNSAEGMAAIQRLQTKVEKELELSDVTEQALKANPTLLGRQAIDETETQSDGAAQRSIARTEAAEPANPIEARVEALRQNLTANQQKTLDRWVARFTDGDITLDRLNTELDALEARSSQLDAARVVTRDHFDYVADQVSATLALEDVAFEPSQLKVLSIFKHPKVMDALDILESQGYDTSVIHSWFEFTSNDATAQAFVVKYHGQYSMGINSNLLTGKHIAGGKSYVQHDGLTLEHQVIHEVFHAFDDSQGDRVYSTNGVFLQTGIVWKELEKLHNSGDRWIRDMFDYPLHKKVSVNLTANQKSKELYAQLMAAYHTDKELLRVKAPQSYTIAEEIHHELTLAENQRSVSQGRSATAKGSGVGQNTAGRRVANSNELRSVNRQVQRSVKADGKAITDEEFINAIMGLGGIGSTAQKAQEPKLDPSVAVLRQKLRVPEKSVLSTFFNMFYDYFKGGFQKTGGIPKTANEILLMEVQDFIAGRATKRSYTLQQAGLTQLIGLELPNGKKTTGDFYIVQDGVNAPLRVVDPRYDNAPQGVEHLLAVEDADAEKAKSKTATRVATLRKTRDQLTATGTDFLEMQASTYDPRVDVQMEPTVDNLLLMGDADALYWEDPKRAKSRARKFVDDQRSTRLSEVRRKTAAHLKTSQPEPVTFEDETRLEALKFMINYAFKKYSILGANKLYEMLPDNKAMPLTWAQTGPEFIDTMVEMLDQGVSLKNAFLNAYERNDRRNELLESRLGPTRTGWVKFDGPEQALELHITSNDNPHWCIGRDLSHAEGYLDQAESNFYLYVDKGRTLVSARVDRNTNELVEWSGHLENQRVPEHHQYLLDDLLQQEPIIPTDKYTGYPERAAMLGYTKPDEPGSPQLANNLLAAVYRGESGALELVEDFVGEDKFYSAYMAAELAAFTNSYIHRAESILKVNENPADMGMLRLANFRTRLTTITDIAHEDYTLSKEMDNVDSFIDGTVYENDIALLHDAASGGTRVITVTGKAYDTKILRGAVMTMVGKLQNAAMQNGVDQLDNGMDSVSTQLDQAVTPIRRKLDSLERAYHNDGDSALGDFFRYLKFGNFEQDEFGRQNGKFVYDKDTIKRLAALSEVPEDPAKLADYLHIVRRTVGFDERGMLRLTVAKMLATNNWDAFQKTNSTRYALVSNSKTPSWLDAAIKGGTDWTFEEYVGFNDVHRDAEVQPKLYSDLADAYRNYIEKSDIAMSAYLKDYKRFVNKGESVVDEEGFRAWAAEVYTLLDARQTELDVERQTINAKIDTAFKALKFVSAESLGPFDSKAIASEVDADVQRLDTKEAMARVRDIEVVKKLRELARRNAANSRDAAIELYKMVHQFDRFKGNPDVAKPLTKLVSTLDQILDLAAAKYNKRWSVILESTKGTELLNDLFMYEGEVKSAARPKWMNALADRVRENNAQSNIPKQGFNGEVLTSLNVAVTKYHLATAYLEMGDPAGAAELLSEMLPLRQDISTNKSIAEVSELHSQFNALKAVVGQYEAGEPGDLMTLDGDAFEAAVDAYTRLNPNYKYGENSIDLNMDNADGEGPEVAPPDAEDGGIDFARAVIRDPLNVNTGNPAAQAAALRRTGAPIPTSLISSWIKRKGEKVVMGGMFGHDFAAYAQKYLPGVKDYFSAVSKRMVERTNQEQIVATIMRDVDDKLGRGAKYDQLNSFLLDSQYKHFGKYFEQPSWLKEPVDIDQDFLDEFNKLDQDQKDLARRVFEEGNRQWYETQKAIEESLPEGETIDRNKLPGLYVPMKRVGSHVVVARSPEYIEKEALADQGDKDAKDWIEENKTNEDHYYVSFHDGLWAALQEEQAILEAHPGWSDENVRASEAEFRPDGLNEMGFQTYRRIADMVESSDMPDGVKKSTLKRLVQQLYVQSLNDMHAQKTRLKRQRIAGANPDALRVFALQGRANAALVASLRTTEPLQTAVQDTKSQARTAEGKATLNELLRRHYAMTDFEETPWQNMFTQLSSVHFLLTSPMYYLTNMTQPFLMSLPIMAGRHGYGNAWGETLKAWNSTKEITSLFKQNSLDLAKVGQLKGNVGREEDMARELMSRNHLDIGMNVELSDYADPTVVPLNRNVKQVVHKLRGIATNVETLNRLSTALAAYRMEYAKLTKDGMDADQAHAKATEYADQIILDTHGDYSGYNAPRYFMQGNSRLPIKVMTQFRKFQLIQISLLVKLTKDAFAGSTAEEKAVARASLTFLLGQIAVLTGGLGLPLVSMIAAAGLGGDGEDEEVVLRKLIGDPTLAQLLLHGVPAALGVDISNRLGMQNTFNPASFINTGRSPEDTLKNYAAGFVGGPSLSMAMSWLRGYDLAINQGQYWKGAEAMMPTGVAALSRGLRFSQQGITSSTGDTVMKPEEVSAISAVMQSAGLPTTQLTDRVWKGEALAKSDQYFADKSGKLTRQYAEAWKARDANAMAELRADWRDLQQERIKMGYSRQPMTTLTRAGIRQLKRENTAEEGIISSKASKAYVEQLNKL